MNEGDLHTEINDYLSRFLLRYFCSAVNVRVSRPDEDVGRDIDLLRLHWAISEPVCELIKYLSQHRHEIQTVLESQIMEDDVKVRGRFDARATMIRRLVTGYPTLTVSHEPVRTYESGPNHVLTWVLETAWRLALHFEDKLPEGASYRDLLKKCTPGLEKIRRFDAIHQASKTINLTRRPGSQALKAARRSRHRIYVLAYHAYHLLHLIEARDEDSINRLLNDTLLGPLKLWQRYELAAGLAAARTLSDVLSKPIELGFLCGGGEPICRIGGYEIYWQNRTQAYEHPQLEPSEKETAKLLEHYGLKVGVDRPDLVVLDENAKAVSIIEVKCFLNQETDNDDAVRIAMGQLVRYARGYLPITQIRDLLDTSIVAVVHSKIAQKNDPKPYGIPLIIDFDAIKQSYLEPWASHLVSKMKKDAWERQYRSTEHNSELKISSGVVH